MTVEYPKLTWLPMLDRGCCCSLEMCCKLQGYLTLIFSLLNLIFSTINWAGDNNVCHMVHSEPTYGGYTAWWCGPTLVFNFIYGLVVFTVAVVFLVGITQGRASMLTPYLVMQYIQLTLVIHLSIVFTAWIPIISLFATLPAIAWSLYCLLCVNSLRAQLRFKESGIHPLHNNEFNNAIP